VLATLVRDGAREQILYWDEVESAGYGINIAPKPHHLAFKKAWYALSAILERRVPKTSTPVAATAVPTTWRIKPAIESP